MLSENQIETELIKGMKRIAVPYQNALNLLQQHCLLDLAAPADTTVNLQPAIQLIAEYERALAPVRQQWNSLRKTPGPQLEQLIETQSTVLQEILELLQTVEGQMVSNHSLLASKLDNAQRRTAMRQAYHS